MLVAILYLILTFFIGYQIVKKFFGSLFKLYRQKSFTGKSIKLRHWMVTLPASYLTGTLLITWTTYLVSYVFHKTGKPLLYGNIVTISVFSLLAAVIIIRNIKSYLDLINKIKKTTLSQVLSFVRNNLSDLVFVAIVTVVSCFMMTLTLYVEGDSLHIGQGVYGDFGPHLAVIRSFSFGSNFPTEYPHFSTGMVLNGANNIRYHFMFQFLAGNLEYLGLRIDWAFNIPSILSMISFLVLLYSLTVILINSRFAGYLSMIFFFFRSSFAFFTYASEQQSFIGLIHDVLKNRAYIGKTEKEWWGIWNQSVFINQRHFAFSLAVLVLTIIIILPLIRKMVRSLSIVRRKNRGSVKGSLRLWLGEFALTKNCWVPENILRALALGVMVGAISFWNGAVVFSIIPILFFMAIMSKHRLEYLFIALTVAGLALLESTFFVGSAANTVSPRIEIGFLANIPYEIKRAVELSIESHQYLTLIKNLPSLIYYIGKYYLELLGIMPLIVIASLMFSPKGMRWLALCFLTPAVLATTVGLTNDITVNHKFVNISVFLLNIFAAYFIYRVLSTKTIQSSIIAVILIASMTITGVVDNIAVFNSNRKNISLPIKMNHPISQWVQSKTGPNEVFLTDQYIIHPILFGGRKIFLGSPAFSWSAGYDTFGRNDIVRQIYGGMDPSKVKRLVEENNIAYIVIEDGNRGSKQYELNEELIDSLYGPVEYENPQYNIKIYKTK